MKYQDLIAEFTHAQVQLDSLAKAFERTWVIAYPVPASDDHVTRAGLALRMHRSRWSSGKDGPVRMTFGFYIAEIQYLERGHLVLGADYNIGEASSNALRKVAEIKAQVELWQGGFRDELPTQAEVDEL